MLSITIDWLSFTVRDNENTERFVRQNLCNEGSTQTTPLYGYTMATKYKIGCVRYTNPQRPEMGSHFVFSGSTLKSLYDSEVSPFDLLETVVALGAKITRLDLAKDLRVSGLQIEPIWQAIQAGEYSGNSRNFRKIESLDGGYTIYIGAQTSDRQIRIYNKGAETKTGADWMRFEIQLREDAAKTTARVLAANAQTCGAIFDGIARKMFSCNVSAYLAFRGDNVPLSLPKIEKQTDREAWIINQVIVSVMDHVRMNRDSKAAYRLYKALASVYEQ